MAKQLLENSTMENLIQLITDNLELIYILVLAIFVGVEVIGKVPQVLHTPLMSGSNALSGVVIVGSILVLGTTQTVTGQIIGFIAVVLATLNVVGGFAVTDRMLEMFKKKKK